MYIVTKTKHRALIIFLSVCGAVLAGFGQGKDRGLDLNPDTRSVRGMVTYAAHEPVRGAVVKCTDMHSLQIRSYITDGDGRYHFSNLSTNIDYELKAEYKGRESHVRTLSRFNERKVARVDLRLR